jgi:hypothetical protein
MADFGTILNKDNKTLDLYCNSITTASKTKNPYLYASLEPYVLNSQVDRPLIYNTIISYNISASQIPRITFTENGIYLLTASITGGSSFDSVFPPQPFIKFQLLDATNTIIQTSSGLGITPFGLEQINEISQTFTVEIKEGYYILVILGISGAPPEFNIIFDTGNLNITKISN